MVSHMLRKIILVSALLLIALFAIYAYITSKAQHDKNLLVLYGNVDVRQVDLGFQVPGRVESMEFQEGDFVLEGALMGMLENQPYHDQVKQSEANLEALYVNYLNAEKLLERRLQLIPGGGVAQEDVDNAIASKEALAANIKQAGASLDIARINLGFIEVKAPTDGIILTRIREPGAVVNVGEPIYTLSVSRPVWIRAFVPEINLGQIYPGMDAEIATDNPQGKVYKGKIGFISPVAEFTPKTVETTQLRTDLVYRLRIYVDEPDDGLRQGMPVTATLRLNK